MMDTKTAAATKLNDHDLIRHARGLEQRVIAAMTRGDAGTQHHLWMIDTASAYSAELVRRGYSKGRKVDGSDIPRLVSVEDGIRYNVAVLVF